MPLISCLVWVVVMVVIAGVLVWALKSLPLDATIQVIGKVAIVVIFVIALLYVILACIGHGVVPYPLR
jgi:hypothetical protein